MLDATFEVQLTNEAEKHYKGLDKKMTRRVNKAIDMLVKNPFFGKNIVKLKGQYAGLYRYRVGSYRIVYSIDKTNNLCVIKGIYRRGKAYRLR